MPRRKSINEFPGYVRVGQPNYEVLSALVKKAVGDRSLAEFSELTGISTSTISRIINNKFSSPSSDSVIARVIDNIDPGSGVTREDKSISEPETKMEDNQLSQRVHEDSRPQMSFRWCE